MDIDFRGYTEGDHVDYATFAISHDGDIGHRAAKPRIEFDVSERERLLIRLMVDEGPPCPYAYQVPLEGGYGTKTCNKGCWEEPNCGDYEAAHELYYQHRDLFDAVMLAAAHSQNEHNPDVREHPEHPLHDWIANRDPEYATHLAEWRADIAKGAK